MSDPFLTLVRRLVLDDDPRRWLPAIATHLSGTDDPTARGVAAALVPVLERQSGWGRGVGDWPLPALARVMASDPLSPHYGYWVFIAEWLQIFSSRTLPIEIMQLQARIVEADGALDCF